MTRAGFFLFYDHSDFQKEKKQFLVFNGLANEFFPEKRKVALRRRVRGGRHSSVPRVRGPRAGSNPAWSAGSGGPGALGAFSLGRTGLSQRGARPTYWSPFPLRLWAPSSVRKEDWGSLAWPPIPGLSRWKILEKSPIFPNEAISSLGSPCFLSGLFLAVACSGFVWDAGSQTRD